MGYKYSVPEESSQIDFLSHSVSAESDQTDEEYVDSPHNERLQVYREKDFLYGDEEADMYGEEDSDYDQEAVYMKRSYGGERRGRNDRRSKKSMMNSPRREFYANAGKRPAQTTMKK